MSALIVGKSDGEVGFAFQRVMYFFAILPSQFQRNFSLCKQLDKCRMGKRFYFNVRYFIRKLLPAKRKRRLLSFGIGNGLLYGSQGFRNLSVWCSFIAKSIIFPLSPLPKSCHWLMPRFTLNDGSFSSLNGDLYQRLFPFCFVGCIPIRPRYSSILICLACSEFIF